MESENKAIERVTVDRRIKQMTDEEILAEKAKFQNAGDDEMFRPLTIAIAFDISASYLQRLRCEGGGVIEVDQFGNCLTHDHETVEVPKPKNNFTRNLLLIYLLFILIVGVINFFN